MEDNYTYLINSPTDIYYYDFDYEIPSYDDIRLSIFFIAALCVGVPCLIWAFYFALLQRKSRGRISAFIILLLLCDLLQLLLYICIVLQLLYSRNFYGFHTGIIVFGYFCLKVCGVHLQKLVSLEGVLTLKYPLISAHIFSKPCYIIISIIILIFPVMCAVLMAFGGPGGLYLAIGSILAPVCLLVVTGIITYKAPPTPARTPVSDNRPGASMFLVTMVTLVVLYLPCVLVHCVQILYDMSMSWIVMSHCLLSLTVISEPLQCVLVCRENLSTQTKLTHIELDSEQTSYPDEDYFNKKRFKKYNHK